MELNEKEQAVVQAMRQGGNVDISFHCDSKEQAEEIADTYKWLRNAEKEYHTAPDDYARWITIEAPETLEINCFYNEKE